MRICYQQSAHPEWSQWWPPKFSQLVKLLTTGSGSLLDHIYNNCTATSTFVDVADTYHFNHDAAYIFIPMWFFSPYASLGIYNTSTPIVHLDYPFHSHTFHHHNLWTTSNSTSSIYPTHHIYYYPKYLRLTSTSSCTWNISCKLISLSI